MLKVKTVLRFGKILLGSLLIAGLAGPAFAGNVWSWRTEDGAYAFTNDSKRIPAKHRAEARQRSMGKLSRYDRYTEVSAETEKPYADRVRERQSELRERTGAAPIGAAFGTVPSNQTGLAYSVPASGGGSNEGARILVPLSSNQASSEFEPTTVQDIRVKPRHSLATRHFTVVKQGDRIVTVIKAELNQQPLDGRPESDFE